MNCDQYWKMCESEDSNDRAEANHIAAERHLAGCARCQAARQALVAALAPLADHPPLSERQRQLWLAAAEPAVADSAIAPQSAAARGPLAWLVPWIATAAILLLAIVVLHSATKAPAIVSPDKLPNNNHLPLALASPPTYSPITIVPLSVQLCFGQIEQDLQASAARVEEVSEAVALAEVERDLHDTLQRAHRWDD
ncbi:MAG: hypothetical protein WD872_08360 [Pirellulaceae bacterium]